MRFWLVVWLAVAAGCPPPPNPTYLPPSRDVASREPRGLGALDHRTVDFVFDGGQIELELYRRGTRVVQTARNRYAAPIMIRWTNTTLENLEPLSSTEGVALLPAADRPLGRGPAVVLGELEQIDPALPYHRGLTFKARFGDPQIVPEDYDYRLPYPTGRTFAVLQGFHGAFSHSGSNEYAVDFDLPVATPVLATRPGIVVASNAIAQGAGTTPEYLDYKRTNFVLLLHDDGSLGEYLHLAPSSVEVAAGQRVERGQQIARSVHRLLVRAAPSLPGDDGRDGRHGGALVPVPVRHRAATGRGAGPGPRYVAWE